MEVVSAAKGFKPEQVGQRLANIWSVDGLSLQLVAAVHDPQGHDNHCAMTLQPITKHGMTADGFVYQLGYIKNWLTRNATSPLTGLDLEHRHILRMTSEKEIIDHFLSSCRDQRGAQRVGQEEQAKAYCQTGELAHKLDQLRQLDAYVATCSTEVAGWQRHVDKMQVIAEELRLKLQQKSHTPHLSS